MKMHLFNAPEKEEGEGQSLWTPLSQSSLQSAVCMQDEERDAVVPENFFPKVKNVCSEQFFSPILWGWGGTS